MARYEKEIVVCQYRVFFWYLNVPEYISDELMRFLDEEAESRARAMIVEDYAAGELNYETNTENYRGWWKIIS